MAQGGGSSRSAAAAAATVAFGNWHSGLPAPANYIALALVSALCGMTVGLERERKQKPAGIRTLTLVALGSTVFTFAGYLLDGPGADRGRVAAQVASGIGFLGAGAIIKMPMEGGGAGAGVGGLGAPGEHAYDRDTDVTVHSGADVDGGAATAAAAAVRTAVARAATTARLRVSGITTAADIWLMAAIGVLCGVGYAAASIGLSLFTVLLLVGLEHIEGRQLRAFARALKHQERRERDARDCDAHARGAAPRYPGAAADGRRAGPRPSRSRASGALARVDRGGGPCLPGPGHGPLDNEEDFKEIQWGRPPPPLQLCACHYCGAAPWRRPAADVEMAPAASRAGPAPNGDI